MPGAELVERIMIDAIDDLLGEERPVLAACIRKDADYDGTLEDLETVAIYAGPCVRICVVLEDLLPFFESRYGVTGTPTFLLVEHGTLKDSLLGKGSVEGLMDFIAPYVQETSRNASPRSARHVRVHREKHRGVSSSQRAPRKRGAL
ncbi:MAG TPA: thioredoxin family protein [Deltaproteobacteria bacterium]|nr:thioredoxin family protein [Deltaproteobacteria bacterium]